MYRDIPLAPIWNYLRSSRAVAAVGRQRAANERYGSIGYSSLRFN